MKAAVLREVGARFDIRDDVQVQPPGPNDVRVRVAATGVCHSDLSVHNGTIPQPLPAVLGHEAAGEVVEVGAQVASVRPGDHVIVCWVPPCGRCRYCRGGQPQLCLVHTVAAFREPRFRLPDGPAFGMAGCGTFAEEVVLPEPGVVPIDSDVPFEIASLVGCAVITGVGAVLNAAQVRPGSSVVVFGCGGVGLNVVQGARLAGAAEIVAVDPLPTKRDAAHRFGATHAAAPEEVAELSGRLTGGDGFDYGFEVVGRAATIRAAYDATRRGGTTVVVGVGRADDMVRFSAFEFFISEKKLTGSIYGSSDVRRDYDRLLRLWRAGRLDLEPLISRRLTLDELDDAFSALDSGEVLRQVVTF